MHQFVFVHECNAIAYLFHDVPGVTNVILFKRNIKQTSIWGEIAEIYVRI
jgi:hypothetical protein